MYVKCRIASAISEEVYATGTSWYQLPGSAARWLKVISQLSTWLNSRAENLDDSASHDEAPSSEHLSATCSKWGSLCKVTVAQSVFIFVFLAGYDSNWRVFSKPGTHFTLKIQQAILNPTHTVAKRVESCGLPDRVCSTLGVPAVLLASELHSSHSDAWRLSPVSENFTRPRPWWILSSLFSLGH